jgi:hypothetical protein
MHTYLLVARGGGHRFKAGLDLDLVATKTLVGSDKGCFGIFALKT